MKRIFKKIVLFICFTSICYSFYTAMSIHLYSKVNHLTKADAAIVLGAAVWGDEPSPVFRERINHGIWLYKNDYVEKIIFTGGNGGREEPAESRVAKDYAENNLVPDHDILIEAKSKITQENLLYAKEIAIDKGISSFLIVSDPLHMKRAMLMAEDYEMKAFPSPTPTTRYRSWKSKTTFLAREVYYYIGYRLYIIYYVLRTI